MPTPLCVPWLVQQCVDHRKHGQSQNKHLFRARKVNMIALLAQSIVTLGRLQMFPNIVMT